MVKLTLINKLSVPLIKWREIPGPVCARYERRQGSVSEGCFRQGMEQGTVHTRASPPPLHTGISEPPACKDGSTLVSSPSSF